MTPAQKVLHEMIDEAVHREASGWIAERVRYAQERSLIKALRKIEQAEEDAVNPPPQPPVIYEHHSNSNGRPRSPWRRGFQAGHG